MTRHLLEHDLDEPRIVAEWPRELDPDLGMARAHALREPGQGLADVEPGSEKMQMDEDRARPARDEPFDPVSKSGCASSMWACSTSQSGRASAIRRANASSRSLAAVLRLP